MAIGAFLIDRYPVTNAQFSKFLVATGYTPTDTGNFLRHWDHNGTTVPQRLANSPVVWISFDDARAYCTSLGKRLPDEWEWAFAAQGPALHKWPWGDEPKPECMPPSYNMNGSPGSNLPAVDSFDSHGCSSPFGAEMMVGAVWQWTNQVQDDHTATALLKGGSVYFRANSSVSPDGQPRSLYYFANCASDIWAWEKPSQPGPRPIECHGQYYLMYVLRLFVRFDAQIVAARVNILEVKPLYTSCDSASACPTKLSNRF